MIIKVDNPYGLTGSEPIDGLSVYFSKTKFTTANLPAPYIDNKTSYSSYSITLPEYDQPYWVMWAYRGRDNQRVYSPAVCLMDFSPELTSVFNGNAMILQGDAQYGRLQSILDPVDLVYPDTFCMKANLPYRFNRGNSPIGWYLIDSKRVGVTVLPNKDNGAAIEMYENGFLGRSGTMVDVYSPTMMSDLGPHTEQGRTVETMRVKWNAYVPTLDEFRLKMGVIFQTGIPTIAPAITMWRLTEGEWYLTSTESTTEPGKFYAINSAGNLKSIAPDDPVAIYLMFDFALLSELNA